MASWRKSVAVAVASCREVALESAAVAVASWREVVAATTWRKSAVSSMKVAAVAVALRSAGQALRQVAGQKARQAASHQ